MPGVPILTIGTLMLACSQSVSGLYAQDPSTSLPDAITIELVASPIAISGTWLDGIDIVMTNSDSIPFHFSSGADILDFQVLDENDNIVWKYLGGGILPSYLRHSTIGPYQSISVSELARTRPVLWNLRSGLGYTEQTPLVEPGIYHLKGFVTVLLPSTSRSYQALQLETDLQEIVIH